MRFLYIDSQGKEVPIPSVDALALRVELGAITETTQFYDSAADRWAPAGEHEIFRSLQREAEEKSSGYVAPPPPPLAPPPVPRVAPPPPPGPAAPEAPAPEASAPEASAPEASAPEASAPPKVAESEKTRAPDPFEAIEGPGGEEAPAPEATPEPASSGGSHDVFGGLDFGLTLDDSEVVPAEEASSSEADDVDLVEVEPTTEAQASEKGASQGSDFEGFGGALLEDEDEEGEEEEEEEGEAAEPAARPPAAEGGLEIEGVLAASYGFEGSGAGAVSEERIETEASLAELDHDQTSEWALREEPAPEVGEREPSPERPTRSGAAGGEGGERPPRARPAAPVATRSSKAPALLGAGVAIVLLGVGWFGWNAVRGEPEAVVEEEVDPPVAIPELPAELEPRIHEVAALALADWGAAIRDTLPLQLGVPAEPDGAWLGSQYMADASRFASVGNYWSALDGQLTAIESREQEMFLAFYGEGLVDSTGAVDPDAEVLTERAGAGFQAARPDRRVVYRQLRAVIDAAAGLHEFLLENEDLIDYRPEATRDPVLEAVPETPALGDEMWDRVDEITTALDRLGALEKITTERLMGLVAGKVQEIGIR